MSPVGQHVPQEIPIPPHHQKPEVIQKAQTASDKEMVRELDEDSRANDPGFIMNFRAHPDPKPPQDSPLEAAYKALVNDRTLFPSLPPIPRDQWLWMRKMDLAEAILRGIKHNRPVDEWMQELFAMLGKDC